MARKSNMKNVKKNNKPKVKVVKVIQKQQVRKNRPKRNGRKTGGTIGQELGGIVGMPGIGRFLGSAISRVFGRGDYDISGINVRQNSLVNGTTPPAFGKFKNVTTVCHREYIQDITTGPTLVSSLTAFNSISFSINPGVAETFPWLYSVANNFEEYEIIGMIFEFKSTSANALNSTNTALGTVILSTDYNVLNAAFSSKQEQENYEFAQSVKPSQSCIHPVECARMMNPLSQLYVRNSSVPAGADDRLYDLGNFQISTIGMQAANVNIGELWVSYHVALYKPKLPTGGLTAEVLSSSYTCSGTMDATHPLGTIITPTAGSNLELTIDCTAKTITFPLNLTEGLYLIMHHWYNSGATVGVAPVITAASNCQLAAYWDGASVSGVSCPTATSSNKFWSAVCMRITGAAAVVNVGVLTLPGTITGMYLDVVPVNPLSVGEEMSFGEILSSRELNHIRKFLR